MTFELPEDLEHFVLRQVDSGAYHSPDEVLADALRIFRGLKAKQEELRAEVRLGLDEADRGLSEPLDVEELFPEVVDGSFQAACCWGLIPSMN